MLLIESEVNPAGEQAHAKEPGICARNASKDIDEDGEHNHDERHMPITYFSNR